jgi:hypothetical protein
VKLLIVSNYLTKGLYPVDGAPVGKSDWLSRKLKPRARLFDSLYRYGILRFGGNEQGEADQNGQRDRNRYDGGFVLASRKSLHPFYHDGLTLS